MTSTLPKKTVIGWLGDQTPDWGNIIMTRVDEREPFTSEAGYSRLLVYLDCVRKDTEAFDNLKGARKLLPPLMSTKFFLVIQAEVEKLNVDSAADYEPLREIKAFEPYSVVGWLLVIQRMLFNIKFVYNMHYWAHRGDFGFDTWCKYDADKFDVAMNRALDIYYDGELTPKQDAHLDIGRAAAVARIDSLSKRML